MRSNATTQYYCSSGSPSPSNSSINQDREYLAQHRGSEGSWWGGTTTIPVGAGREQHRVSSTGWEQHQKDCSPTSHPYLLPTRTLLLHTSQLLAASSSSGGSRLVGAEPCGEFPCPEPQTPEANLRILEPAYQRRTWGGTLSPEAHPDLGLATEPPDSRIRVCKALLAQLSI